MTIRSLLTVLFITCLQIGYAQSNKYSYPTDTTVFAHIEGYVGDSLISYKELDLRKKIKLITDRSGYEIVQFSVMINCPETEFIEQKGDTISHSIFTHFRSSPQYGLYIVQILAKTKTGHYFWIKNRYYQFK